MRPTHQGITIVVGFFDRLAYATAVALGGFLLAVMPGPARVDPSGVVARLVDLPVALAGLILPAKWKGIDLWFSPEGLGYFTFPEALIRHLRIAIPVYMFLFYLPSLAVVGWRRLRHRHESPGVLRPTP